MQKLIVYLIRKKLGLRKYEKFRFSNQRSKAEYYFSETNLWKIEKNNKELSGVSLNWLLDHECEITKVVI